MCISMSADKFLPSARAVCSATLGLQRLFIQSAEGNRGSVRWCKANITRALYIFIISRMLHKHIHTCTCALMHNAHCIHTHTHSARLYFQKLSAFMWELCFVAHSSSLRGMPIPNAQKVLYTSDSSVTHIYKLFIFRCLNQEIHSAFYFITAFYNIYCLFNNIWRIQIINDKALD